MDDDWDAALSSQPAQSYSNSNSNSNYSRNTDWRENSSQAYSSSSSRNANKRNFDGGNRDYNNQRSYKNDSNNDRSSNNSRGSNFGGDGESFDVPSNMVGKIIGRGGSQITDLQEKSSARIQVTKETNNGNTVVKICGDQSQIKKAKELINELIGSTTTSYEKPSQRRQNNYEEPSEPVREDPSISNNSPDESDRPKSKWYMYLKECDERAEAEWNKLPPVVKMFYEEHAEITAMTEEQVERFRTDNNNIVVDRTFKKEGSKPIPKPVKTFEHAFFNYPEILEEIAKVGFEKPSPIQAQAWPVLLSGEDLIGIAQTGTGKTLAFLLPAFIHIMGQNVSQKERDGPAVLIMAPTRELALQIDREIKKYQYKGITSVCVYGGGDRRAQVDVVNKGVDIVIATPGRMNDLHEAGHLHVKSVTYVVLDEADRMLDMGFEPQIRKVMYSLRPTKQCIMTSATWPPGVRRLAESYMTDPIQVYVGSLDLAATHSVTQVIQLVDKEEKEQLFMDFVHNMGEQDKIIVFCGTKAKADYLSVECALKNISCAALHGNREQMDREQAVADIGDGTVRILIATDVASRGLDIDDITHVLNYDFPRNIEEYVHRVGRTGRAGKNGETISFFTREDWGIAAELIKILEEAQQFVPEELHGMAERFEAMKKRREENGIGSGGGRGRGGGRGGGGGGFGGRNRRY